MQLLESQSKIQLLQQQLDDQKHLVAELKRKRDHEEDQLSSALKEKVQNSERLESQLEQVSSQLTRTTDTHNSEVKKLR